MNVCSLRHVCGVGPTSRLAVLRPRPRTCVVLHSPLQPCAAAKHLRRLQCGPDDTATRAQSRDFPRIPLAKLQRCFRRRFPAVGKAHERSSDLLSCGARLTSFSVLTLAGGAWATRPDPTDHLHSRGVLTWCLWTLRKTRAMHPRQRPLIWCVHRRLARNVENPARSIGSCYSAQAFTRSRCTRTWTVGNSLGDSPHAVTRSADSSISTPHKTSLSAAAKMSLGRQTKLTIIGTTTHPAQRPHLPACAGAVDDALELENSVNVDPAPISLRREPCDVEKNPRSSADHVHGGLRPGG